MKQILVFSIGLLFGSLVMGQDPVNWTFSYNEDEKELVFEAEMQSNWVIYSQHTDPDGPVPTYFELEDSEDFKSNAEVEELSIPEKKMDDLFGVEVIKFNNTASFSQKMEFVRDGAKIKGSVTYMTCDNQRCLPPKTVPFEVKT
ncbi:MAG: hypothetical protein KJO29_05660 [Bacteroidia bacterium]|nr:hypothetical protein [Bacteroidia bacterium]